MRTTRSQDRPPRERLSLAQMTEAITYPGARRPDRQRTVDSHGLAIAVYEWGDADAPPMLLAHGGMDFAGTFDVFAPLLAEGGFRVVSWDHRGHGDSQHAALYNWEADLRDSVAVFDSVSSDAVPVVGPLQGRQPHAAARGCPAPPGEPPHQPRRPALAPQLP